MFTKVAPLIACCLALPLAHAKDSGQSTLKVDVEFCEYTLAGGPLAIQVKKPADPTKPVFLFLPGVNRSLLSDHPVAKVLTEAGAGLVTMNFSSHPLSIAGLASDKKPGAVTLESLAQQVSFVRRYVGRRYGLTNLIPVSLSYSGAVSAHLKGFPVVIDLVPLTSSEAQNPKFKTYRQLLRMNPFMTKAMERSLIDGSYRSTWGTEVDEQTEEFGLPPWRRTDMIEGLTHLSRAVEDFSWDKVTPEKNVRRVFVIAALEDEALRRDQVKTLLRLKREGYPITAIVMRDAGHMIFNDQPLTLALVLAAIAVNKTPGEDPFLFMLTPSTGQVESLDGEAAISYLNQL